MVKDTRAPERKKCSLPPGITRNATAVLGRGDTVRRSGRGQLDRWDGWGNGERSGRSEEACRATGRWGQVRRERRKGDPSQREEDPRKHPDAAVQLSSQNMQCRSWGLLVRLFRRRSKWGDLLHRISARTSGAQNFFLSHVTFGIARSSCLSKALQPKGTIP